MTRRTGKVSEKIENERQLWRRVIGAFLFPLALFPFLGLITYDWRDISWLHTPPLSPPANIIGVVGAWSVFVGYTLFGLVLWILPFFMLLAGAVLITGKKVRIGVRLLWLLLCIISLCSLLQLGSDGIFKGILDRINMNPNAGGAVGYWVMTKLIAYWFSPVGGSMVMGFLLVLSLVMIIGLRHITNTLLHNYEKWQSWRVERADRFARHGDDPSAADTNKELLRQRQLEIREQANRAKEEAWQARIEERKEAGKTGRTGSRSASKTAPPVFGDTGEIPVAGKGISRLNQRIKAARSAASAERKKERKGKSGVERAGGEQQYVLPPVALLDPIPELSADHGNVEQTSEILEHTLAQFNVPVQVIATIPGPVVTQYELRPAPNIKVERIKGLSANLQMALEANSLRVEAPIPGKNAVGIEVPNRRACPVIFREVMEGKNWKKNRCEIPLLLGKDVAGNDMIYDLTKAPHLLVAGATGSGKSVCLNAILCGLLMSRTPEQLRLILIDPKRVELTCYNDLPHLLVPVINEPRKVAFGLTWAIREMEQRYKILEKSGCKNIVTFNNRQPPAEDAQPVATQEDLFNEKNEMEPRKSADNVIPEKLPYIVIVIDEAADIIAAVGKEVEPAIARLTALSRAVGIHLIVATQRPSVDVITGTIKSNIPGRIAFKVSQSNDSRTILDNTGAEELIGRGDFLFLREGSQLIRGQGAWINEAEIARVVAHIKEKCQPCYDNSFATRLDAVSEVEEEAVVETSRSSGSGGGIDEDEDAKLLVDAVEVMRMTRRASTTMLQRRLRIGYTRAARLMDTLEEKGIVSAPVGTGARDILVDLDQPVDLGGGSALSEEN